MSYTFELNNERKDSNFVSGKVKSKSPVVEIFSAMVQGKDLAPYGGKADVAAKYIMELNEKAASGDLASISELNEIRRFVMQPVLLQEIKLLSIFGNYQNNRIGRSRDRLDHQGDILRFESKFKSCLLHHIMEK